MINKKKKKGFTIVELVIVIVIIGVLAAVLIPTFGSLIQKANEAADKQTVYQMNIIVASELIDVDESLNSQQLFERVKDILIENDIDVDNLSPASDDLEIMWDNTNRIFLLVRKGENNTFTQIYPAVGENESNISDKVNSQIIPLPTPSDEESSSNESSSESSSESDVVNKGTAIYSSTTTTLTDLDPGNYYLAEPVTLTAPSTISGGITIDLNGNNLTIEVAYTNHEASGANAVTVNGSLTIKDESKGERGQIYIKSDACDNSHCGICINVGGTLKFENVDIYGERFGNNIENYGGYIYLNNSNFYVNNGTGIISAGTSTLKNETDSPSYIIAAGGIDCSYWVYSDSATITNIGFKEENEEVSYGQDAPIYSSGKTLNLINATINTTADFSVSASGYESLTIEGGEYDRGVNIKNTKSTASTTISGSGLKIDLGGSQMLGSGPVTIDTTGATVEMTSSIKCLTLIIEGTGDFKANYDAMFTGAPGSKNITLSGKTKYYTKEEDATDYTKVSVEAFRQTHTPPDTYGKVTIEDAIVDGENDYSIDLGETYNPLDLLTKINRYFKNTLTSTNTSEVTYKNCTFKGNGCTITVTGEGNYIKGAGLNTYSNNTPVNGVIIGATITDTNKTTNEIITTLTTGANSEKYTYTLTNCTITGSDGSVTYPTGS